jgi:hypothetical protein
MKNVLTSLLKDIRSEQVKIVDLREIARAWAIWLNLGQGKTDLIARLTGVCAFLYFPLVLHWTDPGRQFIQLTPLRFGNHILELAYPTKELEPLLFFLQAISCLCILLGSKRKVFFAIPASILAYHACLDSGVFSNAIWMVIIYLVALLFWTDQVNPCRRIIQIAITVCYAHATLNRLTYPDFMAGYSLQQWLNGWELIKPEFAGHLAKLQVSVVAWQAFSVAVNFLELSFALGFWFKRTRKAAVVAAALFHAAIYVLMIDTFMLFSGVMWAGLLAFVEDGSDWWIEEERIGKQTLAPDRSSDQSGPDANPSSLRLGNVFASLVLAFLLLFPLRILFWQGRAPVNISFADRQPFCYAMFLCRDYTVRATIHYQDAAGHWNVEPVLQRFGSLSSDNHLYSLARYAFRKHADATCVRIDIGYLTNKRWLETKTLVVRRSDMDNPPPVTVRSQPFTRAAHP